MRMKRRRCRRRVNTVYGRNKNSRDMGAKRVIQRVRERVLARKRVK